jgi:hypothetical protein
MSARNVLFIMCDQLRRDHLGCYGHPTLRTRNIDALAARGVRFDNAFVTSGVCGPSRMSFYTGRHVSSHGATWNRVPLSVRRNHARRIPEGQRPRAGAGWQDPRHARQRQPQAPASRWRHELETLLRSGHFIEVDRHDGHHAEPYSPYADWLRAQGYDSADPWTDYVISAQKPDGEIVSGWHMRNAGLPARVAEPHSKRPIPWIARWTTSPRVATTPGCCTCRWSSRTGHTWHRRLTTAYSLDDCLPLNRDIELENPHPVLDAYRTQEECANFMRKEVSDTVRPAYQG